MTSQQRDHIERLLAEGRTAAEIEAQLHVSRFSVAAIKAHRTMRGAKTCPAASPPVNLARVAVVRKTGDERLHRNGTQLKLRLLDFWCWSDSDLLSNAVRGRLAEYLVAVDIGAAKGVRKEWIAYDLTTRDGDNVEVKSASYIQTWAQRRNSTISFDIQPTLGWNPDTAQFGVTCRRQSQVYVFALLHHADRATIDPLDVGQWVFYVIATSVLDARLGNQKTLSLSSLLALSPRIAHFGQVGVAIREALGRRPSKSRVRPTARTRTAGGRG